MVGEILAVELAAGDHVPGVPTRYPKAIYTTNAIESLNFQIRKIIKTRWHFPSDDAAFKLLYLALSRAQRNGPCRSGTGITHSTTLRYISKGGCPSEAAKPGYTHFRTGPFAVAVLGHPEFTMLVFAPAARGATRCAP